MVTWWQIW